ncbi:MAG: helix-turn-helix transcriptional regulator [Myxococcales bacterium]|nr:helix-turn-helix transcriptional regulator [Myxococcales bacterium]
MPSVESHLRSLGERIRGLRAARGMARRDLSRHASVSERYLVELERGRANPSAGVLWRIAEAMNLDFGTIFAPPNHDRPRHRGLSQLIEGLDPEQQEEAFEHLRKHLKPKVPARRGVALVGLRGAGKTTLGARLAAHFDVPFVRLSERIVALGGMKVDELFSLGGQKAYRRFEREALDETLERHPRAVVEAGGSLVSEPRTFRRLCSAYRTIWLRAAPEEHMQRVIDQGDLRPMRGNPDSMEDLRLILAEREADYASADAALDTTGRSIEACFEELVRLAGHTFEPIEIADS